MPMAVTCYLHTIYNPTAMKDDIKAYVRLPKTMKQGIRTIMYGNTGQTVCVKISYFVCVPELPLYHIPIEECSAFHALNDQFR